MKVLVINNKDSFVYILVDYVAQQKCDVIVVENTISLEEVKKINPDKIIISPGPGHPKDSTGNVIPIIRKLSDIPTLGVCLGHQAVIEAFGGIISNAPVGPKHGKVSLIYHDGKTIFADLPNPFEATRYHSLSAVSISIPPCLEVSAKAEDDTIMGVRHRKYPVEGIQFHPESILTDMGMKIIKNFLEN